MKTALILGVDGQDGSYLAELLLSKKYQVIGWVPETITVSYENIDHISDQINIVEGNILNDEGIDSLIKTFLPDEIYNLAAPSSPSASWNDPITKSNVIALGPVRLLEAIRKNCPEARYYQASSSELFGEPIEVPQNENTPFNPRNPYGIAKLYAHWFVVNCRKKYGLFAVSGIMYNHESPRRGLNYVTRKITHSAAEIKMGLCDELLLGNLDSRRDWGYAKDYVTAMWIMLQQDTPEDYVVGTGKTHTVREFCDIAFNSLGLDYKDYVKVSPNLFRENEEKQLVADSTKIRNRMGWKPELEFYDLVQTMVTSDLNSLDEQN